MRVWTPQKREQREQMCFLSLIEQRMGRHTLQSYIPNEAICTSYLLCIRKSSIVHWPSVDNGYTHMKSIKKTRLSRYVAGEQHRVPIVLRNTREQSRTKSCTTRLEANAFRTPCR